ncbi:MAG: RNA polymerase sigma factor [Acidobacteriia bacterium]|nr:RNA polymerase sigma factor [Terriglobia bacterium]
MVDSTDRILVENTLRGDELAFAELVRRYQTAIWRTVRRRLVDRLESEDAVQEIFLRTYTSLYRFDTSRPFDRWIMRITTNYCIDVLRHRRSQQARFYVSYRETPLLCGWNRQAQDSSSSPSELRQVARLLLSALKPNHRSAFVLRELKGLEYAEIARALQISPVAARVRVSRARKEMHRKLRSMNDRRSAGLRMNRLHSRSHDLPQSDELLNWDSGAGLAFEFGVEHHGESTFAKNQYERG